MPSRPCSMRRARTAAVGVRGLRRPPRGLAGARSRMPPGRSPTIAAVVGSSTMSCSRKRSTMSWPSSTRSPGTTSGRSERRRPMRTSGSRCGRDRRDDEASHPDVGAATLTRRPRCQPVRSRPVAPRSRASPVWPRRHRAIESWSGRVSMSRPPSPPLTSSARRRPETPRTVPSPGVDVEARHDARRQVDESELLGLERELLAAERRSDRDRRAARAPATYVSPVSRVLPIGRRQSSMRSARSRRRSRSDAQRAERREDARVVAAGSSSRRVAG